MYIDFQLNQFQKPDRSLSLYRSTIVRKHVIIYLPANLSFIRDTFMEPFTVLVANCFEFIRRDIQFEIRNFNGTLHENDNDDNMLVTFN